MGTTPCKLLPLIKKWALTINPTKTHFKAPHPQYTYVTRNGTGAFVCKEKRKENGTVWKMPFCTVIFLFQYMKPVSPETNGFLTWFSEKRLFGFICNDGLVPIRR